DVDTPLLRLDYLGQVVAEYVALSGADRRRVARLDASVEVLDLLLVLSVAGRLLLFHQLSSEVASLIVGLIPRQPSTFRPICAEPQRPFASVRTPQITFRQRA